MIDKEQKIQEVIQSYKDKAVNVEIVSDVPFSEMQLDLLWDLNRYCVQQVMGDSEVARDPRKINYKSGQELHMALSALCLSQAMINPERRNYEKKAFFYENINVFCPEAGVKEINFGKINQDNVLDAVYFDVVEDWKIYRDREGFGIKGLIDDKTNLIGLDGFQRGSDPICEFSRFHRKYTEKERKKEERAQEAFRDAMIQSVVSKVTEQQLLEGKSLNDMMQMIGNMCTPSRKRKQQQVDPQIENRINTLLLEDTRDRSSRER